LPVIPDNFNEIKQSLLSDSAFVTDIDKIVKVADSLLPEARKYLDCDKLPEQPVCHMSIKFQYYVLRNQPLEKLFPQALHAFAAASQSKAIVGVNLVQAEDGFISLRDYRKQMQVFDFLHQAYPEVHIALHAGELSSTDVIPENLRFHINDAIKVGHAERIGHGVDIAFEDNADALVNYMASKPIPVEINLVSNEKILNVYGKKHPLRYYLNHNVPVVLSTDDEGILRTDLTHQYVDAIRQHGVNYPTVKMINRNVLTYSFLPGDSLWQNSALAQPVAACTDLNSPACLQFVAKSEKASLQRNLELKLKEFEAIYE
jgi:adenosine deaminase